MPRLYSVFLIFLGLLLPAFALAEPAIWDAHSKRVALAEYVDYWQEDSRVALQQVQAMPEQAWTAVGNESANFGYGNDVYWFRFQVSNVSGVERASFVEVGYPVLDHIEVYLPDSAEPIVMGDKQPFHDRPIHHRHFVVPMLLPVGETVSVYLRVETTSSMQVPLTLWDRDAFYEADHRRTMLEGIYYGVVFVMILYNLFVFLAVRERSFLYYVGYITAMPLFLASLHGVGFQYLWPEGTWWNDQSIIVFLNLTIVFGGAFSIRFISVTPETHPWLNRWTVALVIVSGLAAAAGLFIPYKHMILPTILIAAVGCTTMLVLSVVRWVKHDPAARYYTVAWVFMLSGGIVLALNKFTFLPRNLLTENATQPSTTPTVIWWAMTALRWSHAAFSATSPDRRIWLLAMAVRSLWCCCRIHRLKAPKRLPSEFVRRSRKRLSGCPERSCT